MACDIKNYSLVIDNYSEQIQDLRQRLENAKLQLLISQQHISKLAAQIMHDEVLAAEL